MPKPIFKLYQQNQAFLIPPSLEDMIDANHPVRVVSDVIERIDMDLIIKKYKGGRHYQLSSAHVTKSADLCLSE